MPSTWAAVGSSGSKYPNTDTVPHTYKAEYRVQGTEYK